MKREAVYQCSFCLALNTDESDEIAAGKYYVWNESNYQSDPATAWVLTTPE